ncbi:MAG: His Kinase (phospho-acceptor) protein [Bacteroidetes bacterium]|jgi:HPt (histidine-containing phosphotransfer) domain-containing protein|nr:His Kinase (phospho-acceptor) protein [Bacteroidota bacterium]
MKNEIDNQKITDLRYLIGLSKGNQQFVTDMIKIFLEENPKEIELLEKAINEKDYPGIKASAHKLKSTTPFVGINKVIGSETAEVEKLATEKGDMTRIETLFAKIKEVCARAASELAMTNAG